MDTKQVIVVRHDLIKGLNAVRRGKMMAQVAHASMGSLLKLFTFEKSETLEGGLWEPGQVFYKIETSFGTGTVLEDWLLGKFTKIVVSVPGEKELLELKEKLEKSEYSMLPWVLVTDAGLTEFKGVPTNTCIGIGPYLSDKIDEFTKDFPLL